MNSILSKQGVELSTCLGWHVGKYRATEAHKNEFKLRADEPTGPVHCTYTANSTFTVRTVNVPIVSKMYSDVL